jgi:hypothetical protein
MYLIRHINLADNAALPHLHEGRRKTFAIAETPAGSEATFASSAGNVAYRVHGCHGTPTSGMHGSTRVAAGRALVAEVARR